MSKKNKQTSDLAPSSLSMSHAAEYRIIKHDLLRVVILNIIYLAAVLTLFYTNKSSHYMDGYLSRWLHF